MAGTGGLATSPARAADDRVEVAAVRFNALPPEGAIDPWYEMDVELDAQPATDRPERITRRLEVQALVGYDVPGAHAGERRWVFFRAAARLVGLAPGRAHVRFYLPPEIVRRDRLGGAPKFWEVQLAGEGLEPVDSPNRYPPALAGEPVRREFQAKVAADGAANDGVLQPQYLTPFANAYPRSTPGFIRKEA